MNAITSVNDLSQELQFEAEAQFNSRPPRGLLTNPGTDLLGWEKVPDRLRANFSAATTDALADYPEDWPELEYLPISGYLGPQTDFIGPNDGYNYMTISTALVAPLSRGTVDIASNDTEENPIIDPHWFSEHGDIEVAVAGFRRSREFMKTRSVSSVTIGEEYYPGLQVQTDEQIVDWLRNASSTIHHACCTASMGRQDNPNAVVDSDGRVIGVSGLRVVDASILPFLTPGHPMSVICKFPYPFL